VALGVPGKLRPRIFSTFSTTRVGGRQPTAPAAFTPGEISGTHFPRLSRPQSTWFCQKEPRKKSPVTPLGIDPRTVRLVAQRLSLNMFSVTFSSFSRFYIEFCVNLKGLQGFSSKVTYTHSGNLCTFPVQEGHKN